jgi:hypothetical protein
MWNEMTMEEKLAYVQKAIELGADVELKFHDIREEKEAEKVVAELSEIVSIPFRKSESKGTRWFKIQNNDLSLETVVFFDKEYLEEDVQLDGMGGEENAS